MEKVKGFAARWSARAVVVLLASAPALGVAVGAAGSLRDPYFGASVTPGQALPGRQVQVDLRDLNNKDDYYMVGCQVWFDGQPKTRCPGEGESPFTASVTVPKPRGPGLDSLNWEVSYSYSPIGLQADPLPDLETDVVPFTILQVDVTVDPAVAVPGKPLKVGFATPTENLRIDGCDVTFAEVAGRCDDTPAAAKVIEITVPEHVPQGGRLVLRWAFTVLYTGSDPPLRDKDASRMEIRIALLPPKFEVSPSTAQPGLPLVVTFRSGTTGVTITNCGITFRANAPCSPARTAVVMIPPRTPVGSTLRIPWFLSYRSTRPGEEPGTTRGVLDVQVVAERVRFTVTAQPGRGPPGKEVTLTITPAIPGISIVDCIGFFPNDAGATCQATDERWLVRTKVPKGTLPGATLLRWGVGSVDATGVRLSDNGALPFEVLPLPATPVSPSQSPARSPSLPPATLPPTGSPTPVPSTTTEGPPPPAFVARTDPEAAEPGQPVSLSVSALTPGTAITGCRTAFRGKQVVPCDDTGGGWTATLAVPDDAEPGDLPLLWEVTSRTGSARGTIAYRVLGDAPPEPQFGVVIEPASVRPGEHVLVTHQSYDNGPAINGCNAGVAPGGVLAACTNTARGWVADVVVPKEAPPGTATLVWQVTYPTTEGAGTATADGRTNVGVLVAAAEDEQSWWEKVWGIIWRSAGVVILGAALLGGRSLVRRLHDRFRRTPTDGPDLPEGVAVVSVLPAGPLPVAVGEPDAAPRRLIRLTVRRAPPVIRIREEPP